MVYSWLLLGIVLMTPLDTSAVHVIAHRGNSSEAPENTLAAFYQAIDLGVDFIELDVHLSNEGIPIVIHDPVLGRTTNYHSPHSIRDLNLVEIKCLDAGSWFNMIYTKERVPTLEEVLDLPFGTTGIMIEIKNESAESYELANAVADVLEKKQPSNPIFVGSISPEVLQHIRTRIPEQPIIAIVDHHDKFAQHDQNDPEVFGYRHTLLNEELIRKLQVRGKQVWAWTVDEEHHMEQLIQMKIDGLISNKPRVVASMLNEMFTPLLLNREGREGTRRL